MEFKEHLIKYRKWTGKTARELAGLLGVSENLIYQSENGTRGKGMGHINKILELEGWTLIEFLQRFGEE